MTPEQLLQLTPSEVDHFVDQANERLLQAPDEWTRHQAVEDLLTFSSMLSLIGERHGHAQ